MQGGSPANRGSRAFGPILTFADPERLFEVSKMKRKERRRAKSEAEAGVPFRGGRSGGRSDPERLKRNGANGENV